MMISKFLEWHYILAIIGVLCFWLYSAVKKFHKQINKKNNRIPDIKILQKIIPPSCNNGWKVKAVCNALPVWNYSTTFTFAPRNLVATRSVLQGKSSRILEELKNINVFSMIFPDFPTFKSEGSKSENPSNGDVLYLYNMFASLSLPNILLSGQQTELTFERYWSSGANLSWLYVSPTVQLLTSRYGYWICFLIIDMEHDNSSVLHILASYPADVSSHSINQTISSCQVLIKDHVDSIQQERIKPIPDVSDNDSYKAKKRSSRNSSPQILPQSVPSTPVTVKPLHSTKEGFGYVEEPAVIKHFESVSSQGHSNSTHHSNVDPSVTKPKHAEGSPKTTSQTTSKTTCDKEPPKPLLQNASKQTEAKLECAQNKIEEVKKSGKDEVIKNKKLIPYLDVIKEGYELLMMVYEADENTEGWELYNQKDDVIVHKKAATVQFPNDIYKGKTTIKVPVAYLINYLQDMQNKPEYDNVYESGSTVEELGEGITKVISLVYKNIWPVTGRDFCSVYAARHLRDNLYGIMIKAVSHPGCPEKKNKVRGRCIIGGYIFEEVSVETTNITFVVCAEFNGYIPTKIVNKVSSDQPLSVGVIRKKIEHRYKIKDPPDTDGKEYLEKFYTLPSVYPKEKTNLEIVAEANVNETVNVEVENKIQNGEVENKIQNSEVENKIQLDAGLDVTMVTEPVITVEEESKLETQPTNYLMMPENQISTSQENEKNNYPKEEMLIKDAGQRTASKPVELQKNTFKSNTNIPDVNKSEGDMSTKVLRQRIKSCSPTINSFDGETLLSSGFDLKENHYTYTDEPLELPKKTLVENSDNEDTESLSELSQFTDDGNTFNSQLSLAEPVEYPRDSSGQIDYITLGNQCSAALEEEFFLARKVDTTVKHEANKQEKDVWKYQGTSKDVVIMRKTSSKQKSHSFLGRGIINVIPVTVWEMVKTPTTRFVYDSMLKKISTVKDINEKCKIVHMKHETHACFVKQARDFCVMTVERTKQQRYVLSGTSVDITECPPLSDCVRGTIFSSGWIIEPIVQNGKACSLVTYISQVDFGGRLPTRLVNFISKRQPLAVAYLRNYLEAAEQ